MKRLYDSQPTLLSNAVDSPAARKLLATLEQSVPASVLGYFLKFIRSRRRGVALVRHGVCSECHIRVCLSLVTVLAKSENAHLCEHCGRFLLLPDDELEKIVPPAPPRRAAREPKVVVAVAD